MKKIILLIFLLSSIISFSQDKKLWAKSFLNKKAPEITVEGWLSEKPDTKDKFILLDFWATWCGPCKKAIPDLNTYAKKFSDTLVVIGLSDESEEKIQSFTNPIIEYYSAFDTRKKLKKKFKVKGIPHAVLINPEGIVVWEGFPFLRGFELSEEVISKLIYKK